MTYLHTWISSQGLTEDQVAARTGISQASINRYRHGKKKPSPENALVLEKLTGIPAWNFIKPAEQPS